MADLTETASWEPGIYQIETTDLVLGGSDGAANAPHKELANRTSYLKAQVEALTAALAIAGEQSLVGMPYPTIATANNRVSISTVTRLNSGGSVILGAGQRIDIGQELIAGKTGRMLTFETEEWESVAMGSFKTYYLRAEVDNDGTLLVYIQNGADTDSIPGSLKGSADGASGGGFDTTKLSVLLAKIVCGANNTAPTVTALANAARLEINDTEVPTPIIESGQNLAHIEFSHSINWGRKPTTFFVIPRELGYQNQTGIIDIDYALSFSFTRYLANISYAHDFMTMTRLQIIASA